MKGSFTGAIANKRGLLEESSGGTLFLDEIGAVSPSIQVKLLARAPGTDDHAGGGREAIAVDVRLVAASNLDLAEEVKSGRFREDLFYRLSVFPIRVPSLRDRHDDIPLLAPTSPPRGGGVRHRGALDPADDDAAADGVRVAGERPRAGELHRALGDHARRREDDLVRSGRRAPPPAKEYDLVRSAGGALEPGAAEREYILAVLDEVSGHQGHAAEILGIDRRTLYRKLSSTGRVGRPAGQRRG